MITEPSLAVVPPEISETIGTLRAEMEKLRRELGQALDVWQSTLTAEKDQFEGFLKHKELAWHEQEEQWSRQTQTYEERLETMKSDFETRLNQSEQNAAHALAELDDAWQRDKLEWGPSARDEWPDQRRQMEAKIQVLEREQAESAAAREEEKQRHQARLAEIEASAKIGAGPTPSTVKALQGQLLLFQQTVASFHDRAVQSDELVNACVQALDCQISVLYDLVHHYAPASPSAEPSPDVV